MRKGVKSTLLVLIQFSCIAFLLFNCRFHEIGIAPSLIIGLSIILASWSIFVMQKSKLRIFPEPSEEAFLITNGPYQIIRHPMYTSVLLCCFGFVLINFNLVGEIVYIILFLDLLFKLHWEEAMLNRKFTHYSKYSEGTNKLIPFIY